MFGMKVKKKRRTWGVQSLRRLLKLIRFLQPYFSLFFLINSSLSLCVFVFENNL